MRRNKATSRRVLGLAIAASVWAASGVHAQSTVPGGADWISVDRAARKVTLSIVSGTTEENLRWNFNGYFKGAGALTIPVGYQVEIDFNNADPYVAHSIGVGEIMNPFPAMFTDPQPVFAGGMSSNAASPTGGTAPGQSETLQFTADRAGTYGLICHMPAHALTGMWLTMEVVESGEVGFDSK